MKATPIAFDTCIASAQACVSLYTIWVGPTTTPVDVRLRVVRPTCPHEGCWAPLLRGCSAWYYVVGGTAILNGPPCTVATPPSTWSRVKELYGE